MGLLTALRDEYALSVKSRAQSLCHQLENAIRLRNDPERHFYPHGWEGCTATGCFPKDSSECTQRFTRLHDALGVILSVML